MKYINEVFTWDGEKASAVLWVYQGEDYAELFILAKTISNLAELEEYLEEYMGNGTIFTGKFKKNK